MTPGSSHLAGDCSTARGRDFNAWPRSTCRSPAHVCLAALVDLTRRELGGTAAAPPSPTAVPPSKSCRPAHPSSVRPTPGATGTRARSRSTASTASSGRWSRTSRGRRSAAARAVAAVGRPRSPSRAPLSVEQPAPAWAWRPARRSAPATPSRTRAVSASRCWRRRAAVQPSALYTASRQSVPLLAIVSDNRSYGSDEDTRSSWPASATGREQASASSSGPSPDFASIKTSASRRTRLKTRRKSARAQARRRHITREKRPILVDI